MTDAAELADANREILDAHQVLSALGVELADTLAERAYGASNALNSNAAQQEK